MRLASNALKLFFLAALATILLAPAWQMATGRFTTGPYAVEPIDENRVRAQRPPLAALAQPASFVTGMRLWFRDNYGFRDLLIRAKTEFDYRVFGVSDRLYLGADGWMFYRSVIDTEQPGVERMSDAALDRVVDNIAALRDRLAARGVRLMVVTNQLKDRFYPEYLPRAARYAARYHRFDDFRARLHRLPGIDYVDTTDRLLALKRERRIFHKTDFHWNDPAAFEIARDIVDTIGGACGRESPVWRTPLSIQEQTMRGGQALFMPLLRTPAEQALVVAPRNPPAPPRHDEVDVGPFEFVSRAAAGAGGDLLPTTVLFGDSFSDGYVRVGLQDYFQAFLRARRQHAKLADVLAQLPGDTKVFIYQFIDITLSGLDGDALN